MNAYVYVCVVCRVYSSSYMLTNVTLVPLSHFFRYVRASINFDHDAPPRAGNNESSMLEITGEFAVGMDYKARGSSGSVVEVAFKPTMDLEEGLHKNSLTPTISFLGSDPIPVNSDPVVMLRVFATTMVKKIVSYSDPTRKPKSLSARCFVPRVSR